MVGGVSTLNMFNYYSQSIERKWHIEEERLHGMALQKVVVAFANIAVRTTAV